MHWAVGLPLEPLMSMTLMRTLGFFAVILWAAPHGSPRQVSVPSETTTMTPDRRLRDDAACPFHGQAERRALARHQPIDALLQPASLRGTIEVVAVDAFAVAEFDEAHVDIARQAVDEFADRPLGSVEFESGAPAIGSDMLPEPSTTSTTSGASKGFRCGTQLCCVGAGAGAAGSNGVSTSSFGTSATGGIG